MARHPVIQRYLDAGMAFTDMTRARAEDIVRDLVSAGEVQAQRAEELATQIVDRSRANTDRLLGLVRDEVRTQITALGVASGDDVTALETTVAAQKRQLSELRRQVKAAEEMASEASAAAQRVHAAAEAAGLDLAHADPGTAPGA